MYEITFVHGNDMKSHLYMGMTNGYQRVDLTTNARLSLPTRIMAHAFAPLQPDWFIQGEITTSSTYVLACLRPFLSSPLGANFDLQGRSYPQE
jgi:hypothetical protein